MTAKEAQALADQAVQQLLEDPAAWERWASTYSRFHQYSPGNVLLIMSQRPDATMVAGYHAWQALGRQVQRGEHGITILAPVIRKEADPQRPQDPPEPRVVFRAATVFDISQTQGRALDLPEAKPLTGRDMADLLDHLVRHAVPVPVEFAPLKDAYRVWSPATKTIQIRQDAEPNHQLKTLLHEWSHSLGVQTPEQAAQRHVGPEEVTAETTAFILAKRFGIDTEGYSLGYVAAWANGDPQVVLGVQQAVGRRVHAISQALDQAAARDPVIAQAWQAGPSAHRAQVAVREPEAAELSL